MKIANMVTAGAAALLCMLPAYGQPANIFLQTNLVSNVAGAAPIVDPNLVDPWGISFSATSPFWVSNHLSGTSTIYNGGGVVNPTVVTIPAGAAAVIGALGRPTGQVRNSTPTAFTMANGNGASFIFATEDGTISAWNGGTAATIMIDNSASGAVYKGLAIGVGITGPTLYAANFRTGKIDVFNSSWAPEALVGNFTDSSIPSGFAPFNVANLNGTIYVTYALQDAKKFLDVAAPGNGFVGVFDLSGNVVSHILDGAPSPGPFRNNQLNSPWGVAIAPAGWGPFGGALLVGNFGDGQIHAFNLTTGVVLGALTNASGSFITISGLWALAFGNGGNGGDVNTLYFTAGVPNGSTAPRGILGSIAPPMAITSVLNAASELGGSVAPGELVRIGGQTVGPSPAVSATVPFVQAPTTTLGGTAATVNGIPAPILYASSSQTNIQIPYAVAGASQAAVVLTTGGQTASYTVPIVPTAPGIFTLDFSGQGRVVAFNGDGSLNTAANPVLRAAPVWIYATGAGVTMPADTTGALEADTSKTPVAAVSVQIGGLAAMIGTNGSTPADVSGVLQLMVTVPATIASGPANVVLTVGSLSTAQTATIYVK